MTIQNIKQIEELFIQQEPEGQYIEYKGGPYKVIKSMMLPADPPDLNIKHKHELLKDICSFLNSGEGTIILGIKEDPNGKPQGSFSTSGIELSALPAKYNETLESITQTGISRTANVKVELIPRNRKFGFIVINIYRQNHPLFAVLKNENGSDVNDLFIRRGRNIGLMSIDEIYQRIKSFDSFKDDYNTLKHNTLEKLTIQSPMVLLLAYPISAGQTFDVLHSENVEKILRGTLVNRWDNLPYKVSINESNLLPTPTFYGSAIKESGKELEIRESGEILFHSNLRSSYEKKRIRYMINEGDAQAFSGSALDPYPIDNWVKGFHRLALQHYQLNHFNGEVFFFTALLNMKPHVYTYRDFDHYRGLTREETDTIYGKDVGSYYGPHECEMKDIIVETRLNSTKYDESTLDRLDLFVKSNILDYLWRSFGFPGFPDLPTA